jgi:hypothetical protein
LRLDCPNTSQQTTTHAGLLRGGETTIANQQNASNDQTLATLIVSADIPTQCCGGQHGQHHNPQSRRQPETLPSFACRQACRSMEEEEAREISGATCLAVLERVRQTRKPVLVRKRGVPIAEAKAPPEVDETVGWHCNHHPIGSFSVVTRSSRHSACLMLKGDRSGLHCTRSLRRATS